MSKYTTEVRFICEEASGLLESKGYNDIESIIAKAIPKIFNFNFPIFDENYRSVLETKILKHFYTREIGEETVGLWKLRLNTRLNEIMPYYNKLYKSELLEFNPLYTANLQRTKKSNLDSTRKANENIEDENKTNKITNNNANVNSKESSNVKNEENENITNVNDKSDLYSDTPQGSLSGVENNTYLTNARKTNENTNNTKNNTNNTTITNSSESSNKESITDETTGIYKRAKGNTDSLLSTEEYIEEIIGYEGNNGSELLQKFRDTFLNIDVMVINELEDLFFQLW